MARISCPHCQANLEIPKPTGETPVRHACDSCGRPFVVRVPSPPAGLTQKLPEPTVAQTPLVPESPPSEVPHRLGPYEIRGTIGTGGMGVVYRGWDAQLNRHVAVKTLRSDLSRDPEYRERFLREARAAAALSHPNVTQIHFIGEEGGQPFFAMEFLDGKPLDQILREQGRLPPDEALELARQAATGLKAAAARGIIHRDIKPSNLVLSSDGIIKVTDFGLAKLVVSDPGLTMAGVVLGSPNYLAPEQASGGVADLRSDIYSLGATLYELVTGRPPFDGPTPVSIILKHVREPLRSPRQFNPDLPYPLVSLIQRMMAKRKEDRPQTYDSLMQEMERVVIQPPTPTETVRLSRTARPPSGQVSVASETARSFSGLWVVAAILGLGLLAGWGFFRQAGARSSGDLQTEPGATPVGSPSRVLSSTSEIAPPNLEASRPRRRSIDFKPLVRERRAVARANLIFVENTHEVTQDGRLRVSGSVVNTGAGQAASVRIKVVLTDSVGQVINTIEVPLDPPLIAPHQSGTFEAFFPDPRQAVNISTELNWNS